MAQYWQPPTPAAWIGPRARRLRGGNWLSAGYRSARVRANWCRLLFAPIPVLALIQVVLLVQGVDLANRYLDVRSVSSLQIADWTETSGAVAAWIFVISWGLAPPFLAWLSRAVDNLPPLAGGTSQHGPQAAIGWWFVPLANLAFPYLIVREAWERYATPARNGRGWIVLTWWLSFLIGLVVVLVPASGLTYRTNGALDVDANTPAALTIEIFGYALLGLSAAAGFLVVHEMEHRAQERARILALDLPAPRWLGAVYPAAYTPAAPPWPGAGTWTPPAGSWPGGGTWPPASAPWPGASGPPGAAPWPGTGTWTPPAAPPAASPSWPVAPSWPAAPSWSPSPSGQPGAGAMPRAAATSSGESQPAQMPQPPATAGAASVAQPEPPIDAGSPFGGAGGFSDGIRGGAATHATDAGGTTPAGTDGTVAAGPTDETTLSGRRCPNCGRPSGGTFAWCVHCGARLPD